MPIIDDTDPAKTPNPAQAGFENPLGVTSPLRPRSTMSSATAAATAAKTPIRMRPSISPPVKLPSTTPTRIDGAQSLSSPASIAPRL